LRRVVTPEYAAAVVTYRQAHPTHGPVRIAQELQAQFAYAHRGTALQILQQHHLTRPKQAARQRWQIPVGRYRLQMDVQQLPAIQGQQGFEYKISLIHLATRWKYSEIPPDCRSETLAQVYRRALDALPPFLSSSPITP
jgi:SOS response regulatory protein OraA/RecX